MERVALDVEGGHFGVADFDAFSVEIVVEFTANREARLGRSRRDQLDDRRLARERPTAPVLRDMQNRRCSILFHFDVPGG